MTDCPVQDPNTLERLDHIIESLRTNLRALDELGLEVAGAHLSLALEVLEQQRS